MLVGVEWRVQRPSNKAERLAGYPDETAVAGAYHHPQWLGNNG